MPRTGLNRTEANKGKLISLSGSNRISPAEAQGKSTGADQGKKGKPVRNPLSGESGCTPAVLAGWMKNVLFTLRKHRRSAVVRISFAGSGDHKLHTCGGHKNLLMFLSHGCLTVDED